MPADLFAAFPELPGDPPSPPGEDPRSPRPDIVVFVLDDIPPLDGRLWDRLPNIRRTFVERGIRFSDAHGETPTCCPGRAGFLTGLHTHHHGTYMTDGSLFRPGETIATSLQDVGYHTIQVGKYLNLFERVFPKLPPGWSDFRGYGGGYYDYRIWANGVPRSFGRRPKDFSTDVISRMSLDALRDAPRGRPIFAWLTPFAVHGPYTKPPGVKRRGGRCGQRRAAGSRRTTWRSGSATSRRTSARARSRCRAASRSSASAAGSSRSTAWSGASLRELERQDRLDNTLLILTSDNGMTYGAHRILFDKKTPYATAIPFYVRWPRVLGDEPRVESASESRTSTWRRRSATSPAAGSAPTRPASAAPTASASSTSDRRARDARPRRGALELHGDRRMAAAWWSVTTTSSSPLAQPRLSRAAATAAAAGCTSSTRRARRSCTTRRTGPATPGSDGWAATRACSATSRARSAIARHRAEPGRRLVQLRREN